MRRRKVTYHGETWDIWDRVATGDRRHQWTMTDDLHRVVSWHIAEGWRSGPCSPSDVTMEEEAAVQLLSSILSKRGVSCNAKKTKSLVHWAQAEGFLKEILLIFSPDEW